MKTLKLLIIESGNPGDFYNEELDGLSTRHLARLVNIRPKLFYAIDQKHLKKAIKFGFDNEYDVVHLSCHGGKKGIGLANDTDMTWAELAAVFSELDYSPKALVMSACWGGSDGVSDAFKASSARPNIIFGSTDARDYNEYAVAWAILYNAFIEKGPKRETAMKALEAINAVVHKSFRYLRWDDEDQQYLRFPGKGKSYEVKVVED